MQRCDSPNGKEPPPIGEVWKARAKQRQEGKGEKAQKANNARGSRGNNHEAKKEHQEIKVRSKDRTKREGKKLLLLKCEKFNTSGKVEARNALSNFNVILDGAERLAATSELAKYSKKFQIEPLRELVRYLQKVLLIIIERPEETGSCDAEAISQTFTTLCPLTKLLEIIAASLTDLRVTVGSRKWGSVDPLQKQLEKIHRNLKPIGDNNKTLVGVAKCFLFHEEHGHLTVVSTTPAYRDLSGLDRYGSLIRGRRIDQLQKEIWSNNQEPSRSVLKKEIEDRLARSESILEHYRAKKPLWDLDLRAEPPADIVGRGATFDPLATYKVACAIDFCRFRMDRYSEGNKRESLFDWKNRGAVAADTCAEWEFWLVQLSRGPIKPPPDPRYLPYDPNNQARRSNTYPGTATTKATAPARYAPEKAPHLDKYCNPQESQVPRRQDPGKVGRAGSWDNGHDTVSKRLDGDGRRQGKHQPTRRSRERLSDWHPQKEEEDDEEERDTGCFGCFGC